MEKVQKLQNLKSQKLYIRVYDEIRNYIYKNNLKAGDKLPTEMEMCEMLGVSRNVLREAIKSLEITGIVSSKPGVGIIIRDFNVDYIMSTFINSFADGDHCLWSSISKSYAGYWNWDLLTRHLRA